MFYVRLLFASLVVTLQQRYEQLQQTIQQFLENSKSLCKAFPVATRGNCFQPGKLKPVVGASRGRARNLGKRLL